MNDKLKLAILGNGRLANIVVDAYNEGLLEVYEIVGVCGRTDDKTNEIALKAGCSAFKTVEGLLGTKPDYVVEAASVQAIKDNAVDILKSGAQLVTLSIGALADTEFYDKIRKTALENNTKVHLVSGAIGGYDIMRTIMLMGNGEEKAGIEMVKLPYQLESTVLYDKSLLNEKKEVFRGNAADAIEILPGHVNIAVATSLATMGDETEVVITSSPDCKREGIHIYAENYGVRMDLDLDSIPHVSSGWSVVARLRNLASPIVF